MAYSNSRTFLDEAYYRSVIESYLTNLSFSSSDAPVADISQFFHPSATQTEFPNLLNPRGGESDLPTVLSRNKAARAFMNDSQFEIVGDVIISIKPQSRPSDLDSRAHTGQAGLTPEAITRASAVVESIWTGTVSKNLGEKLQAGTQMRARFAMIFEFEEGLIRRQRNYDCFDAF